MEERFDTLNIEYVETRKVSFLAKALAFTLVLLFVFVPLHQLVIQFDWFYEICTYGIAGNCGCIIP